MFTKADYLSYLYLLLEKEREILSGLHGLAERLSDESLRERIAALSREKQDSFETANRIFARLFGLPAEQRRYRRSPAVGDAKLRNLETGRTITCRCLDISLGGLCVQLQSELPLGMLLAIEVKFFESGHPIARRGIVRWCRRIEGQYRAGLQFEDGQSIRAGQILL